MLLRLLAVSWSIACLIPGVLSAQTQPPATRRAHELIALVNSATPATIRTYIDTATAAALRTLSPQDLVDLVLGRQDQSLDLEWVSTQDETPTQTTAVLRHKLAGGLTALEVQVLDTAPFLITSIQKHAPGSKPRTVEPVAISKPRPTAPLAANTDAAMTAELKQYVDKLANADAFSGTVILAKNGKTLYAAAFGLADKDFNAPNTLDTKFDVGAMNTMFTAVAIAQLVEQGKLSYDDPLSRFLPDAPTPAAAQQIRSYVNADSGVRVLAKVIEVVTKQSYSDYMRAHVYQPAGMLNTDAYELDLVNPNLAVGYEKETQPNGTVRYRNNIAQHASRGGTPGGVYSTAPDLLRFAQALQSGMLKLPPGIGTVDHSGALPGTSADLNIFTATGYVAVVMSNYDKAGEPIVERIRTLVRSRTTATP
jgi:CubicO group peptidase (beta-lactamase class C family)